MAQSFQAAMLLGGLLKLGKFTRLNLSTSRENRNRKTTGDERGLGIPGRGRLGKGLAEVHRAC